MIAIVDDDPSVRDMLVSLMRSIGYEARAFGSGEELLASEALNQFTCIITDIQMPGMNGFELKQELDRRTGSMPVIMITARVEPGIEERASSCGAIGFFRKPFDVDRLINLVEKAGGQRTL